jgi:hypothetical protein
MRWSLTEGLVSAIGPVAIQTSASLNPGNSGGPLIDDQGRQVGVVSRKAGEGMAFATRVDAVDLMTSRAKKPGLRGGSLRSFVVGSTLIRGNAAATLGAGVELSLRDTLVFDASAQLPLMTRWDLIDSGSAVSVPVQASFGVRGHAGQGPMTFRAGAYGALGVSLRSTATLERRDDDLGLTGGLGARVEWIGLGLGVGVWYLDGAWPVVVELRARLPGLAVF